MTLPITHFLQIVSYLAFGDFLLVSSCPCTFSWAFGSVSILSYILSKIESLTVFCQRRILNFAVTYMVIYFSYWWIKVSLFCYCFVLFDINIWDRIPWSITDWPGSWDSPASVYKIQVQRVRCMPSC